MKNSGALPVILIINFISSGTSQCTRREKTETPVDFNGFKELDESNITYLISNNETVIEACEIDQEIYDCLDNGVVNEDKEITKIYVVLRYYSQDGNISDVSEFANYLDCVNFMISDEIKEKKPKIHIKKFLRKNNITEITMRVRNLKSEDPEVFCNEDPDSAPLHADERTYSESYKVERDLFTNGELIEYGEDVSVPFLPVSLPSENLTRIEEKDGYLSSWTRTRPSQNITVSAFSGKMLLRHVLKINKLKKYTADFAIDDSSENFRRFKTFRQKLRSGEVSLHQRKLGVHFDFSSDELVMLKNVPIKEYVTKITKRYFLSDIANCDELFEEEELLKFEDH